MLKKGTKLKKQIPIKVNETTSKLLVQYKGEPVEILFNTEDWLILEPYCWHAAKTKKNSGLYARTKTGGKRILMHRLFLPDSNCVDHWNHNGLDNRRENLRAVTYRINAQNSTKSKASKYRGVYQDKSTNTWIVQMKRRFQNELEAARFYDRLIPFFLECDKKDLRLNFPDTANTS